MPQEESSVKEPESSYRKELTLLKLPLERRYEVSFEKLRDEGKDVFFISVHQNDPIEEKWEDVHEKVVEYYKQCHDWRDPDFISQKRNTVELTTALWPLTTFFFSDFLLTSPFHFFLATKKAYSVRKRPVRR